MPFAARCNGKRPQREPARPDLSRQRTTLARAQRRARRAEEALRNLQPPEGALITPELFDQLEAAKRRRYQVQSAMIDFLDTLDDMPP